MMRSLLIAAVLCCGNMTFLQAQSPFYSMHYVEQGETSDEVTHITTQGGDNLIASVQHPVMSTDYFITLFKADAGGNVQWTKKFDTDRPGFRNVVQSNDGSFFLCYSAFPFGNYYQAIRLDQNGNVIFDKRINLPAQSHVTWKTSTVAKADSGYYVGCSVFDSASSMYQWNLMEISASGNVVWTKNYNAHAFLGALNGMEICPNGDVLLLGSAYDIASQAHVGMITRVTPNGTVTWNTRFAYAGHDLFPVNAEVQGADFIVAVQDYQQSANIAAVDFMKIDANGTIGWTMRYTNTNPNSSLLPHDIIVSGGGDFVVIAQRSGPQLGSVFLQVNGTGQYVSSRFYQGYTITSIDNYGQWMYSLTGTRDSMNYHFTALKTVDGSGAGCDDTTAVFGVGPVQYTSTTGGTVLNSTMSAVNGNLPVINTTIATHSDCNLTGVTGHAEMENNISVYPVPAKEQLFISSASEITMIEIIGVNGAVVHSQVVNSNLCVVQTENMADGAYLLRVTDGAGVTVLKTVIAH